MRTTKPHGPPPHPRRRLNPRLYEAVRASGHPGWKLALLSGLTHQTVLSQLVCAETVVASPLIVERLRRVASVVGFDPGQLFLDSAR